MASKDEQYLDHWKKKMDIGEEMHRDEHVRAAISLGTWEPGSHEMFKLKQNFW